MYFKSINHKPFQINVNGHTCLYLFYYKTFGNWKILFIFLFIYFDEGNYCHVYFIIIFLDEHKKLR